MEIRKAYLIDSSRLFPPSFRIFFGVESVSIRFLPCLERFGEFLLPNVEFQLLRERFEVISLLD